MQILCGLAYRTNGHGKGNQRKDQVCSKCDNRDCVRKLHQSYFPWLLTVGSANTRAIQQCCLSAEGRVLLMLPSWNHTVDMDLVYYSLIPRGHIVAITRLLAGFVLNTSSKHFWWVGHVSCCAMIIRCHVQPIQLYCCGSNGGAGWASAV